MAPVIRVCFIVYELFLVSLTSRGSERNHDIVIVIIIIITITTMLRWNKAKQNRSGQVSVCTTTYRAVKAIRGSNMPKGRAVRSLSLRSLLNDIHR